MKTNQILTRKMGDFEVLQRTSDGYFDANALLSQWNSHNTRRRMDKFLQSESTSEFINTIKRRESQRSKSTNGDNQIDTAMGEISPKADFQAIKEVKGRMTKNGKTKDQVWMHPFLFIDFAMWINAEFKYDVIKFVYDQLIEYRNEAGNAYKEMSSAVASLVDKSFMPVAIQNVAKAVNHIVYGTHESEIRNKQADEIKMRELFELEKDVAKSINRGLIKTYDNLIIYLRDVWREKWQPKILTA